MAITFDGGDQDEHPRVPVTWVQASDRRWDEFARRQKAERGTNAFPMRSKWVPGDNYGWFFPAHWVDASYQTPLRKR